MSHRPTLVTADAIDRWLAPGATIIDARSEGEYAEDFIPGAVNRPVLNNEERARVGTTNRVDSPFAARRVGAPLVVRNIADMVERHFASQPKDWSPLVYCWRGGKRSGTLTWLLREIGFDARQLSGGYKAFRARVNSELPALAQRHRYVTICGCTGTGKTALLGALTQAGAQVIDLEGLANHRGSLLGAQETPQPTQKHFDTLLWNALRQLDPTRPVFVESESKKIGHLQMPDAMRAAMAAGDCVWLDVPLAARVAHIRNEYAHFVANPQALMEKLRPLKVLRGAKLLATWQDLADRRDIDALFASLMVDHYDPLYTTAIARNYPRLKDARRIDLPQVAPDALRSAAHSLVA
ncbi:MAG: tRNA 2-selenouridine(34) synthase MnmH [Burkholderiales bacterium]|nr:tRNA 2-selenouridine(34) synthase MnmH [Burkholderiales bacterium]